MLVTCRHSQEVFMACDALVRGTAALKRSDSHAHGIVIYPMVPL